MKKSRSELSFQKLCKSALLCIQSLDDFEKKAEIFDKEKCEECNECLKKLHAILPLLFQCPDLAFNFLWRNIIPAEGPEEDQKSEVYHPDNSEDIIVPHEIINNLDHSLSPHEVRDNSIIPHEVRDNSIVPHEVIDNSIIPHEVMNNLDKNNDSFGDRENPENCIEPYGAILGLSLMHLLFKQGYCIEPIKKEESIDIFGVDLKIIWPGNLQVKDTLQEKSKCFYCNRILVLGTMLMCLSSEKGTSDIFPTCFFKTIFTCFYSPNVRNMIFSLLHIVLSYWEKGLFQKFWDSLGFYSESQHLIELSLDCTIILLGFHPHISLAQAEYSENASIEGVKKLIAKNNDKFDPMLLAKNEFCRIIGTLQGLLNFSVMYRCISSSLKYFVDSNKIHNELLVFLQIC